MGCGGSSAAQTSTSKSSSSSPCLAQNNEDIRDKYDLGAILGSGSFGQVREASLKSSPSAEVRAVKMIERDNEDGEWSNQAIFVREVGLLQQINHENIIRYYDFYEDVHFLYVVMELCKGGEVFAKIVEMKRFSEKNAAMIGQQMLRAVDYIHKINIAHRDIKAENFMLAGPSITSTVKMIDFGMACKFENKQVLSELCGSPHYLAPELIGQKYNHMADVWAFGVLLYLLLYGHYPYDAKHPRDIMVKILTEPIKWQTKAKLSKHALDFVKSVLEHDPKKRASAAEALQHPWMKLADSVSQETSEALPTEVIRSAHKKVTATRKQVDPKIDQLRNEKLKKIDEDFNRGIRQGKRLGETPKEEFMSKPEFVRRENKITTAPSRDLVTRRGSLKKMIDTLGSSGSNPKMERKSSLEAITETTQEPPSSNWAERKPVRSASMMAPRRLSYIGTLSTQEEKNLATLYQERGTSGKPSSCLEDKRQKAVAMCGVLPEPPPALPGSNDDEVFSVS